MPSQKSANSPFAKGVVGCKFSVTAEPFTSHQVNFLDAGSKNLVFATSEKRDRAVFLYLDKAIVAGTYPIDSPSNNTAVGAYVYYTHSDGQYSHYAKSGTLILNSIDFSLSQLDATFKFDADGRPGEPDLIVTEGVATLTGPSS